MKQRYQFDVEFVKYALNFLFVDDFTGGACDFKKHYTCENELKKSISKGLPHLGK